MRKFTILFALLVAMVSTAMAQFEDGKLYRIKASNNLYLAIGDEVSHRYGHVYGADDNINDNDQLFYFIAKNDGKYILKSANNEYITYFGGENEGQGWNVNKTTDETKAHELTFISSGEPNKYYIQAYNESKKADRYFKFEQVTISENNVVVHDKWHPFNDFDESNPNGESKELWTIEDVELVQARKAFDAVFTKVEETLANAEWTKEKIKLTTTQNGDGCYVWTNAQSQSEGPIEKLIDGNTDAGNYFHTAWGNETITPNPGYHFFEIDLVTSIEVFSFDYTTRTSTDGGSLALPSSIMIYGSNGNDSADANAYTLIKTINSGLPTNEQDDQGELYESDIIPAGNSYSHIRVSMKTIQHSNEEKWFHLAEFNLYKHTIEDKYAELYELYNEHINNASYNVDELNDAASAFNVILYSYTLNVGPAGYSTMFFNYPVTIPDFNEEEDGVYVLTSITAGLAHMEKVTGVLPANTGVIVKANQGTYSFNYTIEEAEEDVTSLLTGTTANEYIQGNAYVLSIVNGELGLYKATLNKDATGGNGHTHFLNNANKAYLPATAIGATAQQSAGFRFSFGGTTAIEEITDERAQSTEIYDLQGRRVKEITAPGIYIVNGKKVLYR